MVLTTASLPSTISPFHSNPTSDFRLKFSAAFTQQSVDEGSPDVFPEDNSIADFMRFEKGGQSGELQTAVVSYRKKFPWSLLQPFLQVFNAFLLLVNVLFICIRLIWVSTIHIADKEYFARLKDGLEPYDCVLYEMVASRESLESKKNPTTKRLRGTRSRGFNILGCIQRQMASVLMLDFQLDCLDYQDDNWVHADLDFETFKQLQYFHYPSNFCTYNISNFPARCFSCEEKGESIFTFARDYDYKVHRKPWYRLPQFLKTSGFGDPNSCGLLVHSRCHLWVFFIIGGLCMDFSIQESEYSEMEALSRLDIGAALKVFLAKRLTSEFTEGTADIEEKSVIIGRRLRDEFDLVPSRVKWVTAWSIKKPELNNKLPPISYDHAKISGWPLNRYQTLALLIFSSVLAVDLWFWELFFGTHSELDF
ncbi:unnamed protein product [Rhodiola kirilowii]